ncbi:MAG TPA: monovalent cation:proton antiporter-2 (CPA2) family protein [Burkholderiales bacterium]|nr:monovalent cation:proton antiporter-2 (CPA2) family protein [Burkholderiales bacterium]
MEAAAHHLPPVLVLLASSVLAVVACRTLRLPPMLGYVATGLVLGPHALGLVAEREEISLLAEIGVVFLMFSIGLEFSRPKLLAMRRMVFGLGLAQVVLTMALVLAAALVAGLRWEAGIALGGILAMSSTAVVSKLLAERGELESAHGRPVLGVLLFQDLAVVPLLVLIPALGQPAGELGVAVALALGKATLALALILLAGPRLLRAWLGVVARRRSTELFVLNVLLVILLMAFLTGLAGLSLVLGAFLAGMLISETEYRYQVEEDIKPFRDVLLGVFFITVGMMLDLALVARYFWAVLAFLTLILAVKFVLISALARAFGAPQGTALRVGLALAQAGEFSFVLLGLAQPTGLVPGEVLQPLLAAMLLSMVACPFLIGGSDRILLRLSRSEWMERSLDLHRIAARSLQAEGHVIILGYGRNGQRLARLLESEGVHYIALDLDPERVREASAAGDSVVFADSARREALAAAGLPRATAVVITFADVAASVRVLRHIQAVSPNVPVIVRARDEGDIERLTAAGASEVVPEAFESGVMLASHTLVWVGIPLSRVMRRMSLVRGEQYRLLRGLFYGAGDEQDGEAMQRLHSVTLDAGASALGRTLEACGLESLGVQVRAVRRPGEKRKLMAAEAGPLQRGDVVVLLGAPDEVAAAEYRLLRG